MVDNVTCLILAGGLGTRLGSLVKDIPKPMLKVNKRPFLEYLIYQVRLFGIKDVIICLGHKGEIIENYFSNGENYGLRIRYSKEKDLLGTAGALANAKQFINSDPFVVMNGDSFCDVDFKDLLIEHRLHKASGTVVVTHMDDCSRYNCLTFDDNGAITSFNEKEEKSAHSFINGGIYVFKKTVLNFIPSMKFCSLEKDIFPKLAQCGLRIFRTCGLFIDIGIPFDLERAADYLKTFRIKDVAARI